MSMWTRVPSASVFAMTLVCVAVIGSTFMGMTVTMHERTIGLEAVECDLVA
jgi:hypothetical protein